MIPRYGERLRIGMLIPSVNTVVEPQINALLPDGVALHVTRLRLTGSSEGELRAMAANVEEGASLLADAGVDLIAFHCTAVSMLSRDFMESIATRIHTAAWMASWWWCRMALWKILPSCASSFRPLVTFFTVTRTPKSLST